MHPTTIKSGTLDYLGKNPKVKEILTIVDDIASTDATVLITGESGTGKEIIARLIHRKSLRYNKPFVAVNCGAIAESLQESELFGHAKGAYTGAVTFTTGKFGAADSGTMFMDEVGEISRDMQVKFLRILQFGEYSSVGSDAVLHADVRIIAATNQDLGALVAQGKLREDFYYRLNVIRIELPSLRERKEDITLIARHFLKQYAEHYKKPDLNFTSESENLLCSYDYPGNVRELENMVHRAVILCHDKEINPSCLALQAVTKKETTPLNFHDAKAVIVEDFERSYLTSILKLNHGVISRAAHQSGLSERNFHEKLKKYGIAGTDFRHLS